MHFTTAALIAFSSLAAASSSYDVTNYCADTKYLTLSSNEQGVIAMNQELPSGTSRHYDIVGDHSLAVANNTNYWAPDTAKQVFGTNYVNGVLYYALGLANGNPIRDNGVTIKSSNPACPNISSPDGSTKGCAQDGVNFKYTLCTLVWGDEA